MKFGSWSMIFGIEINKVSHLRAIKLESRTVSLVELPLMFFDFNHGFSDNI